MPCTSKPIRRLIPGVRSPSRSASAGTRVQGWSLGSATSSVLSSVATEAPVHAPGVGEGAAAAAVVLVLGCPDARCPRRHGPLVHGVDVSVGGGDDVQPT